MATAILESDSPRSATAATTRLPCALSYLFAAAACTVIFAACLLAGFAPLGFSIVTVFLFAGPHNWLEARYMLTRMPARWGSLTAYFTLGIGGVLALTAGMAAIRWLGEWFAWPSELWLSLYALWNTALLGWIVALVLLRSRQNPRRDWTWIVPAGLVLIGLNWLWPLAWSCGAGLFASAGGHLVSRPRNRPPAAGLANGLSRLLAAGADLPGRVVVEVGRRGRFAGQTIGSRCRSRSMRAAASLQRRLDAFARLDAHVFGNAALRRVDCGDSAGERADGAVAARQRAAGPPLDVLAVGDWRRDRARALS